LMCLGRRTSENLVGIQCPFAHDPLTPVHRAAARLNRLHRNRLRDAVDDQIGSGVVHDAIDADVTTLETVWSPFDIITSTSDAAVRSALTILPAPLGLHRACHDTTASLRWQQLQVLFLRSRCCSWRRLRSYTQLCVSTRTASPGKW
jgi:hypothetical protein